MTPREIAAGIVERLRKREPQAVVDAMRFLGAQSGIEPKVTAEEVAAATDAAFYEAMATCIEARLRVVEEEDQ